MSLEIKAVLKCDGGCGEEIASEPEHRKTYAGFVAWRVERVALTKGWITVNRGRYHTPAHYCAKCADKPVKPIPRKKNPPLPPPLPTKMSGF
jgi:hypothetical protein